MIDILIEFALPTQILNKALPVSLKSHVSEPLLDSTMDNMSPSKTSDCIKVTPKSTRQADGIYQARRIGM